MPTIGDKKYVILSVSEISHDLSEKNIAINTKGVCSAGIVARSADGG